MNLTPITRRAKNAVARVNCPDWDRVTWAVLEQRPTLICGGRPGPWALVVPCALADSIMAECHHSRWVNLNGDTDFCIT